MAISSTNISMFNIATELTHPTSDIELYNGLFNTCNTAGQQDSGNYHNYNTMALSNALSFKQAIYDYWFSPPDVGVVSHWAYYNHNIDWTIDFVIDNQSKGDVDPLNIYFSSSNNTGVDLFYDIKSLAKTTDTLSNYATGLASRTTGYTNYGGYYFIYLECMALNVGATPFMTITASDTDGVGADTTRTTWTDVNGVWDFSTMGSFGNWIVAGADQNTGIGWNKRTTFTITYYK